MEICCTTFALNKFEILHFDDFIFQMTYKLTSIRYPLTYEGCMMMMMMTMMMMMMQRRGRSNKTLPHTLLSYISVIRVYI